MRPFRRVVARVVQAVESLAAVAVVGGLIVAAVALARCGTWPAALAAAALFAACPLALLAVVLSVQAARTRRPTR